VDVIAERDSQCRVLHRSDFEYLRQENPETAIQLLMALAGELGWRLSRTTRQLTVLQQL
jgi:CRP-like cAMP-binding protein